MTTSQPADGDESRVDMRTLGRFALGLGGFGILLFALYHPERELSFYRWAPLGSFLLGAVGLYLSLQRWRRYTSAPRWLRAIVAILSLAVVWGWAVLLGLFG